MIGREVTRQGRRFAARVGTASFLAAGAVVAVLTATGESAVRGQSVVRPAGAAGVIVFQRTRGRYGDSDIWAIRPDGTGLRRITRFRGSGGAGDGMPSIADATGRVLFLRSTGGDRRLEIFKTSVTGGRARRVVGGRAHEIGLGVGVSSSGTRMAFAKRRGSAVPLWTARANGSSQRRRTELRRDTQVTEPSFSPDGKQLAFVRRITGRGGRSYVKPSAEVSVIGASGGTERVVLSSEGLFTGNPRFSPDGTQLIFGCDETDVCLVGSDGNDRRVIVRGAGRRTGGGIYEYPVVTPAWSPDGTQIVFDCGRELRNICVADADGGNRRTLTRGSRPDWG